MDPNADDASSSYLAHAQAQRQNATIDAFMARMRGGAEPPADEKPPAAPPAAAAGPLRIVVTPKRERPVQEAIGAVAGDVGRGLMVEGAPAVVGGINDAVRNAVSGLSNLGDWLNENVLDTRIPVPSTGSELIDAVIKNPIGALGAALPEKVKGQETVTGHVLREGARFLTGFVPAAGAIGGGLTTATTTAAGAISEFVTRDPNEKGLANFIEKVPGLKSPVTEFLAMSPDDNEALNRLRGAIEGAGLGILTEGVVRGIRALAHARRAKSELGAAETRAAEDLDGKLALLGDPAADPVVVAKPGNPAVAKLAKATRETEAGVPPPRPGQPEVFINFARIDAPDDVQLVIRNMANAFKGEIDQARRGVQTNEQTIALAERLGMTGEDLLARRAGQPFNAEEALAARRLWNTSAEKLTEAARAAADGGPAELYAFRRMVAVHHAIQSEVIAARTETARALQSWRIPAGSGGAEKARLIEQLLEGAGGEAVSRELARRMATLAGQDVPAAALAAMTRRGWAATSVDMVKEAYTLGLLWSPQTHIVNSASNLIVAFQQVYERAAARLVGDVLGSAVDARVVDGEALAMAYGMLGSLKDAMRLGGRALRTGETSALGGKIDLPHPRAISAGTVARERGLGIAEAQEFAESPMGRALDFIGDTTRIPGNLLAAEDEFFKTIAYRGEVHAQALRQATAEGRQGQDLFRRMAELANDPPENLRLAAADAALYSTFQQRTGWVGQSLMTARNSGTLNPTFMVLPFIRTPTNILRYTFERTPLAPLVSQWRDDIAAGGARADLALARMATGTAVAAIGMDLASSGLITGNGPSDRGKKEALARTGWQPNSVVIDDGSGGKKYFSFNRADPVGMVLGFFATVAERLKDRENAPEDFDTWEEIVATGIGAISATIVDKSYFHGVEQVLTAIQQSERGPTSAAKFIDKQTASLVPFSSALNTMRRFQDPVTREVNSPWDAIQAKIIGLSENLPPARDLWGEERKPQEVYGRLYDLTSPAAVTAYKGSAIDDELARLRAGPERIRMRGEFQGADVNFRDFPRVYDQYVRLAGHELKHPVWGVGAKELLDQVVSGKHALSDIYRLYSDGPEGGKASFIRNTVKEYRQLAQDAVMADTDGNADFIAYVRERAGQRRQERSPLAGVELPAIAAPGGR